MSLNLETAKALVLAEIEKEGEGYIYKEEERREDYAPICRNYEEDGTPSCLVGRALDSGGIFSFEQFYGRRTHDDEFDLIQAGIDGVVETLGIAIDDDAYNFLWTLQDVQDNGCPWGEAYEKAVEHPVRIRR